MSSTNSASCDVKLGLVSDAGAMPEGVYNVGNPVFTVNPKISVVLPPTQRTAEDCVAGYKCDPVNILFKTTNSEYGSQPPTIHTVPLVFYSRSQRFSDHLGKCGMPRNRGLNVATDKTRVPD